MQRAACHRVTLRKNTACSANNDGFSAGLSPPTTRACARQSESRCSAPEPPCSRRATPYFIVSSATRRFFFFYLTARMLAGRGRREKKLRKKTGRVGKRNLNGTEFKHRKELQTPSGKRCSVSSVCERDSTPAAGDLWAAGAC